MKNIYDPIQLLHRVADDGVSLPTTGIRTGRSFLIEDGALPWIVHNANDEAAPIRRHIELALCHLAQQGKEIISTSC